MIVLLYCYNYCNYCDWSAERSISQIKYELEALKSFRLEDVNRREFDFWEELREECLLPDSVAFAHDHDLRGRPNKKKNHQ